MATERHSSGNRSPRVAVAVGSAEAVATLAEALGREPSPGYVLRGACAPESTAYPRDAVVPRLGSVDDITRVCDDTGADTVVLAGDAVASPADLRRIASELDRRDVQLLVARALTDALGTPTVRLHPVGALPLMEVEYAGGPGRAAPSWLRDSLVAPLLRALPMVVLVLLVIWLWSRS